MRAFLFDFFRNSNLLRLQTLSYTPKSRRTNGRICQRNVDEDSPLTLKTKKRHILAGLFARKVKVSSISFFECSGLQITSFYFVKDNVYNSEWILTFEFLHSWYYYIHYRFKSSPPEHQNTLKLTWGECETQKGPKLDYPLKMKDIQKLEKELKSKVKLIVIQNNFINNFITIFLVLVFYFLEADYVQIVFRGNRNDSFSRRYRARCKPWHFR